jgi:acetylornithine deacetylase/succinyl-diaminopimelate desuccinylase-like protein
MGVDVHVAFPKEGFPLLIARWKGTSGAPVLAFVGHYNTVPLGDRGGWSVDPLGAEIREGRLFGRGAADMKGALAAVIEATRSSLESGTALKGDLLHIWFAGEGHHQIALDYIAGAGLNHARADWYVDVDGDESIAKLSGFVVRILITTSGLPGHTGFFRGDGRKPINAIRKMAKVLGRIDEIDRWMSYQLHPLFDNPRRYSPKPIVEIRRIAGGQNSYGVPADCTAELDFYLLLGQTPEGMLGELRGLLERIRSEDPELQPIEVTVTQVNRSRPWELNDNHPVVKAIHTASLPILGYVPEYRALDWGSRPQLWEVGEVVHFGIPGRANVHAPDEYVLVDGLVKGARIYSDLIRIVLG